MDSSKIVTFDSLKFIRTNNPAKKIVMTSGCFDILHVGHVRSLQASAALGDVLVVALNTDASVERLKGPTRPVVPQAERAEMLAAYDFVDYIVLFDDDSPENIIKELKPDIWAKGGDWNEDNLPFAELLRKLGVKMVFLSYVDKHSTTKMIDKIVNVPEY